MSLAALRTAARRPLAAAAARPLAARWASAATATAPVEEAAAPPPAEPLDVEALRLHAKKLYKELHRLGRDYPDPEYNFNGRLRRAFEKNATITDPEKLKKQLELAEHIKKEVLAMLSLKKYRHLRRAYHKDEPPRALNLNGEKDKDVEVSTDPIGKLAPTPSSSA
ncbi:hypothetical protein Q8F55_004177 [Vanrija albida]|uniref:Complex 1 LYR protein domain-containing protein n=1 Tax=Vanrija albida TaxID=181172 RepID=A0ABR3Q6D3_9TREE